MDPNRARDLLKIYAPVLRFSGGEKFFPMNIHDYIEGCSHLYSFKTGKKVEDTRWTKSTDAAKRIKLLEQFKDQRELYMQFVGVNFKRDKLPRIVLSVQLLLFVVVIVWGIVTLSAEYPSLLPLDPVDWIKMGLLAVPIFLWPLVDADSKVHLAILLNVFGIFFFGTIYILGFGLLAFALMLGFIVIYLVYYLNRGNKDTFPPSRLPALSWISLLLNSVGGGILGYIFGRPIGAPLAVAVITATSTFLFHLLLMLGNQKREVWTKEARSILVLSAMFVPTLTLPWLGFRVGLFSFTLAWVFVISLAGISLLWYALDPLSPVKPGLLLQENERKPILGWDGRVLVILLVLLLIYFAVSMFVYSFNHLRMEEFLTAAILHFLASAVNILITVGILGTNVASYFLDLFSNLNHMDVVHARHKYEKLVAARASRADPKHSNRYWYYGRVCQNGNWTILQYNYFYAFNDFRSTAGGMNDHEGDWEAVTVYIHEEPGQEKCECSDPPHVRPFGVAYSQHYNGEFRFWEDVKKVQDPGGRESCHPLVYTALGSHANYAEPEVYELSSQFSGVTQRFVVWLGKVINVFRTRSSLVDKFVQEVERATNHFDDNEKGKIAQNGRYDVGSREFAAGDGVRVGFGDAAVSFDLESKVALNLPEDIAHRESNFDGMPYPEYKSRFGDWAFELIDDETSWVKFKGMWGRRTNVEGENGPQGPKWDTEGETRKRWGAADYCLEWLDMLLLNLVRDNSKPTKWRVKAVQVLAARGEADW